MESIPTTTRLLHGRCLCGAVAYRLPDDLAYTGYCHCSDCRRFSGSAFSAFGGIAESRFEIVRGAGQIGHYEKTADTVLGFCRVCGSSLYARKPSRGMIHLRLGTLDDTPSLHPQAHSYFDSRAAWFTPCDALPRYATHRAAGQPAA